MKRKPPTTQTPMLTCSKCAFATTDKKFINRSVKGEYFMLACPFTSWKHFKHDTACDRFKLKDR